ncbi:MAG TPA: maltose alpha-D-glucosyltransferase [Thermodesulfovibrionales bacterium]|nr:maltose alpha-D-glucosyltransferase [Thermodesulfovibrionales bacterium]
MPGKNIFYDDENSLWYKDAVIYQLHVRSFYDSADDGVGDFRGLIKKLDYLENLGITVIWLLPFYPSPLRDDGYDIADYYSINPDYGTLRDFRELLKEAHKRGMRIITELVLNHTSDQHAWFQRARTAKPGSAWRNFYVWSDTPEQYKDARIIFLDFEPSNWTWDPIAKAYYWHRFYSHQPDLNFDNPHVQKSMLRILDFWIDMGVDGLRLDAVPYLFEREGTNCENLPETHQYLKKLRKHVDRKFRNRMLLAEANQWPEDAAAYFGKGDECHMAFHFPVMPRIFMAMQMEDRFPIVDILGQTPNIPFTCQWAMFLRNHDELTLEMVTDEERDYMYRVYAQDPKARINLGIRRRLAPLVGNNRRRIELMNILLFSLPGTPIIYYGDEIGMGDNYYLGDRNGVRTPMQWSSDRNAGFSKANPQKLYLPIIIDPEYHFEAVNAENEELNSSSLLWWMRRVIAMRKRLLSFGRGSIKFIQSDNPKVITFIRQYKDEAVLVVVNLSRFSQVTALELSEYAGFVPEEAFSQNRFPVIKESPYILTLGFHDYFWFILKKEEETLKFGDFFTIIPELTVEGEWERVFYGKTKEKLEKDILPGYIVGSRWFGGKARRLQKIEIQENIPVGRNSVDTQILFLEAGYKEGISETYLLPVSFCTGDKAKEIMEEKPFEIISRIRTNSGEGILFDGIYHSDFHKELLNSIGKRKTFKGRRGEIISYPGKQFRRILGEKELPLSSQLLKVEQSNTSFIFENTFFLKLFRRLEAGKNPDVEMIQFLTENAAFTHIPQFAGAIEYRKQGSSVTVTIAHLQGFVPNQGDAWQFSLDQISQYFEHVLSSKSVIQEIPSPPSCLFGKTSAEITPLLQELIGCFYLEMVSLLGKRTGEMHLAQTYHVRDQKFTPEPFSLLYQRSVYQSMRNLMIRTLQKLNEHLSRLPEAARAEATDLMNRKQEIVSVFEKLLTKKISTMKIRYHGDYHLGQVLFTGNDFVIIDFEGEPARPLSERRLKRSPLRDVAGMIRSFHYAIYHVLMKSASVRPEDVNFLEPWSNIWYTCISGIFFNSYFQTVKNAPFIPKEHGEMETLLQCFLLEKAVYELGYELNNRPEWIGIPLKGIAHILDTVKGGGE